MKKIVVLFSIVAFCALNVNAQFSKNLKNVGKSVAKAAGDVAGDLASDVAANKVADNIIVFMDKNNTVSADNSEYTKRLAKLVGTNYVSVDGLALNYKVYENPEINILSCANGCIRIYSGMMDALEDDELLAIIANQIGHIVNKDCRDNLVKVAKEENASNAAGAQLEKMLSFSGEKLGTVVNELIQIPYTEDQSKKADKYAVALLKKNGIASSALVSALEKFAVMEDNDKLAEADDTIELSSALKFNKVNSSNKARSYWVESM